MYNWEPITGLLCRVCIPGWVQRRGRSFQFAQRWLIFTICTFTELCLPRRSAFFSFCINSHRLYEVTAGLIHKINLNWKLDELSKSECKEKELGSQYKWVTGSKEQDTVMGAWCEREKRLKQTQDEARKEGGFSSTKYRNKWSVGEKSGKQLLRVDDGDIREFKCDDRIQIYFMHVFFHLFICWKYLSKSFLGSRHVLLWEVWLGHLRSLADE